jgi:pimeloyl-ACP methyl ester carboxylesterase
MLALLAGVVMADYHGFAMRDFQLDGVACKVVSPVQAAEGKPWVLRARFWGHEPQTDVALLNRGWHVLYADVGGLFGAPPAMARWDALFGHAVGSLGLSDKFAIEAMSRGGLPAVLYALHQPDRVFGLYLDAPVLDVRSWPGGYGASDQRAAEWSACLKVWGLEDGDAFTGSPLDRAWEFARLKIPTIIVAGDADIVVPIDENTRPFAARVLRRGGVVEVIEKPGVDHHPHSLKDPSRIVEFLVSAWDDRSDRR